MEFNKLTGVVLLLVLVGLIVGVGVLVLDQFAQSVRNQISVTDENVTISSGAGELANTPVKQLVSFSNSTTTFTVGTTVNVTLSTGALVTTAGDGYYDADYIYYSDSVATDTLQSGTSAVGAIATSWLALIVTIVVLALILGMVITNFRGR